MTDPELEPITPEQAVELYLSQREEDASDRTIQAHDYRLRHFIRWCDEENVENLNELSGRRLYEFRLWRKDDGDLNPVSLRTQLCTLRAFIRFCEQVDAVKPDLHERITLPDLDDDEDVRDTTLNNERAQEILDYLDRFEYASRRHVVFALFWSTAMRMGALRALDVCDFDRDDGALELAHRPDDGTALKNGAGSERFVALPDDVTRVVSDWVDHNRPDVTDDFGREPLIATDFGRISTSNLRDQVYTTTRPCHIDKDCVCDDCYGYERASKCERSVSPHCLRRGSITHHLRRDVPKQVVSDRADVSADVLDRHYNEMTESEKMEQRRDHLDGI